MASVWFRWLTANTVHASTPSDHWAQEVRDRCRTEQAAVDQSRAEEGAPTAGGEVLGMSIKAVLRHARGAVTSESELAQIDEEVIGACYGLHASRLQLMVALNAQERIDQVNDLIRGRVDAGLDMQQDRPVVQAMRREIHDSVFQCMADWRTAGQRLMRCAKILPSQLRQNVPWPNTMATVRWSGLSRSVGNALRDAQDDYLECRALLEMAQGQYAQAHRERVAAEHAFSMGCVAGARLSAALVAERAHHGALIETQAGHATSLFRLNRLVLGSAESALA